MRRHALALGLALALLGLALALPAWWLSEEGRPRAALTVGALALTLVGVGWGLAGRRGWARVLALPLLALLAPCPPLGPLLAVYGGWVLLSRAGRRLFAPPVRLYDAPPEPEAPRADLVGALLTGGALSLALTWVATVSLTPGQSWGALLRRGADALLPAEELPPPGPAPEASASPGPGAKARPAPGLPGHWTWTDERGVVHIVSDREKIPPDYR